MLLTRLEIKNFRGIKELSLPLDDLCVLIGENNVGKSTILDALRFCLTRPLTRRSTVFEEYDFHLEGLEAEPSKSKEIVITLTFSESKEDEWSDVISQRLSSAEQVDENRIRSIILRVTSYFDSTVNDFVIDYDFIDLSGQPLTKAKDPHLLFNLQQLVPTFYLTSLRDAAKEFRARSPFWGPFVRALELDEEAQAELGAMLTELNKKVLNNHTGFVKVKEHLKKTAELIPHGNGDPVSINVVPSKIFDILSRTQVQLASKTGAQIPIARHGSGTQSLAVICLFDAFLQNKLEEGYGEYAKPFLALEEPEAHLHPSAIKVVGEMLQELPGQKLISTHSGDLLAGIPLNKIRRLRRRDGEISAHWLEGGVLTDEEISKLDYQVRATRGSLLFSRCWLLVEGETEAFLMSEFARALGYDLYADGCSCVEFSQVGVEKLIKLADQFGIEWFVLADNDQQGEKYKKSAIDQLNGRKEKDHIRLLDHGTMETFLCVEGFGSIYKESVSDQKKDHINAQMGTLEYWQQVVEAQGQNTKLPNSRIVIERVNSKGVESIPTLLKDVIEQARELTRGAS